MHEDTITREINEGAIFQSGFESSNTTTPTYPLQKEQQKKKQQKQNLENAQSRLPHHKILFWQTLWLQTCLVHSFNDRTDKNSLKRPSNRPVRTKICHCNWKLTKQKGRTVAVGGMTKCDSDDSCGVRRMLHSSNRPGAARSSPSTARLESWKCLSDSPLKALIMSMTLSRDKGCFCPTQTVCLHLKSSTSLLYKYPLYMYICTCVRAWCVCVY